MLLLTVLFLTSILSATYAQARNALHLASKTIAHPNNVHSNEKRHRHSSVEGIFASAESTSNATLGGKCKFNRYLSMRNIL